MAPSNPRNEATAWAERVADRSPAVQRSRTRSVERATQIVQAARRLVAVKGGDFTTHELVKEAGVAIQTFYKHFGGKDQVLLALFEELIHDAAVDLRRRAEGLDDPVERIRLYVTTLLNGSEVAGDDAQPRFITTEHWRLHRLYPEELAVATRPVTELLLEEVRAGVASGQLRPPHPEYDAWLVNQLILVVFHYYEYAKKDEPIEEISERVAAFCLAGLGWSPERRPAETAPMAKRPSRRLHAARPS